MKLPYTGNPYQAKDQAKADLAAKFIGEGAPGSSTEKYRIHLGELANPGAYLRHEKVFISVNGSRPGAMPPPYTEIARAILARCTFITDKPSDRARPYNSGEREVARFLGDAGYKETQPGIWTPYPEET